MKKSIGLFLFAVLFSPSAFTQFIRGQVDPIKVPDPKGHYQQEYAFDSPVDLSAWQVQKSGLNVSFGSTDELYLRSEVPRPNSLSSSWEPIGWRGDRLNAQLLIWSPDTLEQVRVIAGELSDTKGHVLSKNNIRICMVRYVLSNFPYGTKKASCDVPARGGTYLMPDRLESFERFDLPGHSVRPVWITVDIPRDANPGIYTGSLEVKSSRFNTRLRVNITVQDQVLPEPHDWKYRLDLWQNPWVIAGYYHVVPWSDEHKSLLKKHLKLYADAGGKYITTYAVHSPWSDNSYRIEGTMIEWLKSTDGSWKFDYSVFDQYVQLAIETGIDKAITIYTPLPWGHRFRYLDESTGNYVFEIWPPESESFGSIWTLFLDDLKKHLEKKGWFERTYIGINENPLENTLAAVKFIKDNCRDWKITYAGDWHPELTPWLDDYSPVLGSEPSRQELETRRSMGFTTTYYVCCTPPRPNNFVFSPPVEGRYLSWYAAACGYDGFLRWAYDAWPDDPVRDARHTLWPAGDCFLIYPGGNSSIRFEKLREGIVDYEKIRILKDKALHSEDKIVIKLRDELDRHLSTFAVEADYRKRDYDSERITTLIRKGEKILNALSEAL